MKKKIFLSFIRWASLFVIVILSFNTLITSAESYNRGIFIDDAITDLSSEKKNDETFCVVPAEIPFELQNIFNSATRDIPCSLLQSLQRVEIFIDETHTYPRAMANARIIKVRKDAIDDPEIVDVLIHELGHVVDLGGITGKKYDKISKFKDGSLSFYEDDLSIKFYSISWNAEGKKENSSRLDFVGGYGSYDMFEDFAEGFLLYIEHGNYFKALAYQNKALRKKYLFFKKYVFNGKEFTTGTIPENLLIREWDITRL